MSDQQDKSEQASPFKQQEARRKGQVPRSQDFLTCAMLIAFFASFSAGIHRLAATIAAHGHWWLGHAAQLRSQWGALADEASFSVHEICSALLPLLAALVVTAVVANLLFSGPVFSLAPIKPDFKRLHPVAGLKKIFSKKMLVEFFKVLIKGGLFAITLYVVGRGQVQAILNMVNVAPSAVGDAAEHLFMRLGLSLVAVMLVVALFDMWFARRDYAQQLRMSKREVKDEYRRREGDPEIRSRRRGIQQQLLKKAQALGKVREADVVVVNPVHYSVALQYRPSLMRAPIVIAAGRGVQAWRINQVARRHGVPILRRPPLARALHALARTGAAVPPSTQDDVAKVYRWVIALPGNKVLGS